MSQIVLRRVRISYPNLFKPKAAQAGGDAKYSAAFILDKNDDADAIQGLRDATMRMIEENFKSPAAKKAVKRLLRDGSEKPDQEGYGDGVVFFNASNKSKPAVVDIDPSELIVDEARIYPGCYVNASVRLWAQDNQYGKRINASLEGVQFCDDGESIGGAAPIDPVAVFGGTSKASAFRDPDAIPMKHASDDEPSPHRGSDNDGLPEGF